MSILSEYHRIEARRQLEAIYKSPQGRDLGRWFLTERGKGEEGNLAAVIREIQDIEAEVIHDLYGAAAPTMHGVNP